MKEIQTSDVYTTEQNEFIEIYNNLKREVLKFSIPKIEKYISDLKRIFNNFINDYTQNDLEEMYKSYWYKINQPDAFVYFIYNEYTKLTKIGCSNNPFKRLNNFKTMFKNHFGLSNALELKAIIYVPDGKMYELESYYHNLFKSKETYGEWFKLTKKDLNKIVEDFSPIINEYDNSVLFIKEDTNLDNVKLDIKPIDESNYIKAALELTLDEVKSLYLNNNESYILVKDIIDDYIKEQYGISKDPFEKLFSSKNNNELFNMIYYLYRNNISYLYKVTISADEKHFYDHVVTFNDHEFKNILRYPMLIYEHIDDFLNKNL